MSSHFAGDLHAGLSNLDLGDESYDLGEGILLKKTYAYLMAPIMVAVNPPPTSGGHHPGPWKAVNGSFSFEVNADLLIPAHIESKSRSKIGIARAIVFLLRLGFNPSVTLPVISSCPFSDVSQVTANKAELFTLEIQPRHFPLSIEAQNLTEDVVSWVKNSWPIVHRLEAESPEFSLAVEAIDRGQFVENSALTLVSLWGALEALFSPGHTEIGFRVSALIASFMEPPGKGRASLQKDVLKLYGMRSAAAHGKPRHKTEHLINTFELLRRVLLTIIEKEKVPAKEDLEAMLFGDEQSSSYLSEVFNSNKTKSGQ